MPRLSPEELDDEIAKTWESFIQSEQGSPAIDAYDILMGKAHYKK